MPDVAAGRKKYFVLLLFKAGLLSLISCEVYMIEGWDVAPEVRVNL